MSDSTILINNNNNKVFQNPFNIMAERQSSANTASNNLLIDNNINPTPPTQQQQINILQQLNLPLSVPPTPAAFQINPKLNPSAPTFTPNPFINIPLTNQLKKPSISTQIQTMQKAVHESLAKLQILSLQLNTLNIINQQNQTIQSLQQYQTLYNQYQSEFTRSLLLNQYLSNLNQIAVSNLNQNQKLKLNDDPSPNNKKNGVAQLETIEEGEDENEEEDDIAIAEIAGIDTEIAPKNEDEGTAADCIAQKVDQALSVYHDGQKQAKIGEHFKDSNPVKNFHKFQGDKYSTNTSTESHQNGEKNYTQNRKISELERIKKQIRGILNKITPENFSKLSQEIASILKIADISPKDNILNTEQFKIAQKAQFKALIKLILRCILEKAVNESCGLFSNQYARLCYSLYLYAEDNELKKKLFRQQLLSLTHSVFKKARNNADSARFIGIITMIGELFTYGLVSWNVISSGIFDELLPPQNALDLEGICKLLKTSGNDFDRHHYKEINGVIQLLLQYANKYDFRTQCLVKEIDEMRQNQWRHKIKKEQPMTLEKIHKEFNKNKKPQKRNNNNQRQQRWPQQQQRNNYNNNRWRNNGGNRSYGGYNGYNNNKYNQYNNRRKPKSSRPTVEFVKDVTLPDRSHYSSNKLLTKTWAMRNSGELAWGDNVELVYFKGDESLSLEGRYPVINAAPGQEVQISASIRTPKQPGRYCTYFRLQKNGKFFGPRVWVDIIVNAENLNMKSQTFRGRGNCATKNEANNNKILSCQ